MASYSKVAGYDGESYSFGLGGNRSEKGASGVRNGLLTIITAVIVILLAVLAVLTFSTANASKRLTDRQAAMTSESYLAESSAQTMLASLDQVLSTDRSRGMGLDAALQDLSAIANSTLAQTPYPEVQATVDVDTDAATVTAHYQTGSGRQLDATIQVNDDLTYTITSWLATTQEDQSTDAQELYGSN